MNIELRKLKVALHLSAETIAFTADIYVDGKLLGYAENSGQGDPTGYSTYNLEQRPLLKQVEEYCKALPAIELGAGIGSIKNGLEHVIDDLVGKAAEEKEKQAFIRKMERKMLTGAVVGLPGAKTTYSWYNFKMPILSLLQTDKGKKSLLNTLQQITDGLKEGEVILNTNIPKAILDAVKPKKTNDTKNTRRGKAGKDPK